MTSNSDPHEDFSPEHLRVCAGCFHKFNRIMPDKKPEERNVSNREIACELVVKWHSYFSVPFNVVWPQDQLVAMVERALDDLAAKKDAEIDRVRTQRLEWAAKQIDERDATIAELRNECAALHAKLTGPVAASAKGPVTIETLIRENAELRKEVEGLKYAAGWIAEVIIKHREIHATNDVKGWVEKGRQFYNDTVRDLFGKATEIADLQAALDAKTKAWSDMKDSSQLNLIENARLTSLVEKMTEVMRWAQAVLNAWNVGDLQRESPLHKKLREVMIAYRSAPTDPERREEKKKDEGK